MSLHADASDFARRILRWFAHHARPLPWRGTSDPYRIWLSEIILQQTRVEQGRDYWQRFVDTYPTVIALAAATEDDVLRLWQGLGYYSRARHLLQAARLVADNGGQFPRTIEDLRRLPGVGPYTAAAIGSMAFGLPAAAVDGNVYRVLARHYGIDTPIDSSAGRRVFAALAAALLPPDRAGDYNQAVMDFGATVCIPAAPRCAECPLADTCAALRSGSVQRLPVKEKALKPTERRLRYVYVRCDGHTALRRRPSGDIWQGLYEPPLYEDSPLPAFEGTLTLLCSGVRHVLTHRVLLADLFLLETHTRPTLPEGYFWIPETHIDRYAIPRLIERLLQHLPPPADKSLL